MYPGAGTLHLALSQLRKSRFGAVNHGLLRAARAGSVPRGPGAALSTATSLPQIQDLLSSQEQQKPAETEPGAADTGTRGGPAAAAQGLGPRPNRFSSQKAGLAGRDGTLRLEKGGLGGAAKP